MLAARKRPSQIQPARPPKTRRANFVGRRGEISPPECRLSVAFCTAKAFKPRAAGHRIENLCRRSPYRSQTSSRCADQDKRFRNQPTSKITAPSMPVFRSWSKRHPAWAMDDIIDQPVPLTQKPFQYHCQRRAAVPRLTHSPSQALIGIPEAVVTVLGFANISRCPNDRPRFSATQYHRRILSPTRPTQMRKRRLFFGPKLTINMFRELLFV